jgi:hypothetical protein
MTNPRDFLGKEIKEGVTLVYPVRRMSDMWLKKITVKRIIETGNRRGRGTVKAIIGVNPDGRRITLTKADRCVVVED